VLASGPLTSSSDLRNEVLSIVPGLEINPSSREPGSVISVTGRGFSAKQRDIIISYDGTVVATVLTSDPVGSFTTTFVVPLSASGLHFIGHSGSLSDAQGGSEVSIQVIPSISLDQFRMDHQETPSQSSGQGSQQTIGLSQSPTTTR